MDYDKNLPQKIENPLALLFAENLTYFYEPAVIFFTEHHIFLQKPYRIPSNHEEFIEVFGRLQDDLLFSEMRLAGVNPMALQVVHRCARFPGK